MAADVLQRLCDRRAADVAALRRDRPLAEVREAAAAYDPISLTATIAARRAAGGRAVIAEIKRASPSKGVIRADVDVAGRAAAYAGAGVAGISVLTEPHEFLGSDEDLREARRAASGIPLLRKDFTVDPYQVWEARAIGADVVLLLVNVLGGETAGLVAEARAAGLEALVEVHDAEELAIALDSDARLVGINARNLRTFETRIEWVEELIGRVPPDRIAVAESGIASAGDVARLEAAGAGAFLVGETLMRADDPAALLREWGCPGD